jgi:ADP-ribose pyrophosphatase
MKPQRLARTVIYEDPWVNLYADRVLFPNGRLIERHHFLDFEKEAVAVLVENENGQLLFVHAYRYITDSIEWEIPGGTAEPGEAILDAARREAFEESGYETSDHKLLYTYHPMNGIANQVFHVVHCRAGEKTAVFDLNEIQATRWLTPDDIKAMIRAQTIHDGFSLTALLLYLL